MSNTLNRLGTATSLTDPANTRDTVETSRTPELNPSGSQRQPIQGPLANLSRRPSHASSDRAQGENASWSRRASLPARAPRAQAVTPRAPTLHEVRSAQRLVRRNIKLLARNQGNIHFYEDLLDFSREQGIEGMETYVNLDGSSSPHAKTLKRKDRVKSGLKWTGAFVVGLPTFGVATIKLGDYLHAQDERAREADIFATAHGEPPFGEALPPAYEPEAPPPPYLVGPNSVEVSGQPQEGPPPRAQPLSPDTGTS